MKVMYMGLTQHLPQVSIIKFKNNNADRNWEGTSQNWTQRYLEHSEFGGQLSMSVAKPFHFPTIMVRKVETKLKQITQTGY